MSDEHTRDASAEGRSRPWPDPKKAPVWRFEQVRDRELEAIRRGRENRTGRPQHPFEGEDAVARAHSARLAGLAVSGGGIRSATFNLGVVQALAKLGLLKRFDYLSVNSGGGFIGGWLTSWIHRRGVRVVEEELARGGCGDEPRAGGDGEETGEQSGGGAGGAPAEADVAQAAAGEEPAEAGAKAAGEDDAFDDRGTADAGQEVEPGPIRWLRQFSNYLTPRVGLFTGDSWAIFETYLRNLLLNFSLVIGLLALILLGPRLLLLLSRVFHRSDTLLLIGISLGFLAVALAAIGRNLGEFFPDRTEPWPAFTRQGWVQTLVVLPLFVSAWFAAHWLWQTEAGALAEPEHAAGVADPVDGQPDMLLGRWIGEKFGWYREMGLSDVRFEVVTWIVFGAAIYAVCWLLGALLYWLRTRSRRRQGPSWAGRWWRALLLSAPFAGALGGALIYVLTALTEVVEGALKTEYVDPHWHLLHVNVWMAPGLVVVFLLTAFLHTGLMGRAFAEPLRQWYSRLGGWLMIYAVTWVGLTGMAIYGPILIAVVGQWAFAALTAGWAGATGVGVGVGRQSAESQKNPSQQTPGRLRRLVISAAPQIFIVGLLALVALGVHVVLSPKAAEAAPASTGEETTADATTVPVTLAAAEEAEDAEEAASDEDDTPLAEVMKAEPLDARCDFFWPPEDETTGRTEYGRVLRCHSERVWNGTTPGRTLTLLGFLLAATLLLSWRVDINEFSMHLLYRNRLIRAYLGASNDGRRQHPFTGFDPEDDLPLADLAPDGGYDGPFPIHNATLNLVAGQELAWQERKGASFCFTPLTAGFEVHRGQRTEDLVEHGYRPTAGYRQTDNGISLGTAVAISGAAASPNMGAASNPTMAFLLTVFNVRLGWWLGNPRHRASWPRMGPRVGMLWLLAELFGQTDETSSFVYLSDGGHFENLGVYELVRRRCHFIVASDAGADPDSTFQDLGNVVRKCCVDFGIEIEVDTERVWRDPERDESLWHCAIGSIRYDKADPGASPGVLLYIKSSLTGDEARDVLTYGVENPAFPHESTADQWFSESQFESYRKLGEHVATTVFHRTEDDVGSLPQERLLVRLQEAWYPPSGAPEGAFSGHARQVDELFDHLRRDPELHFLTHQFYPEWRSLCAHIPEEKRPKPEPWLPKDHRELVAGFFFCQAVLHLMETVYLDLELESEYDHPDNRGWINLFKHWSWAGMLIATWTVTVSTFGARFQHFCRRRLGLGAGAMEVEEHRFEPATLAATVERLEGADELNFLEAELIRGFERVNPGLAERLLVVRIEVPEPTAVGSDGGSALRFTCGFALVAGEELLYLRIQDHLRRLGLGRRALSMLVEEHGVRRLHPMSEERMPPWSRRKFGESELELVRILFRSVVNESRNGAEPAPARADDSEG